MSYKDKFGITDIKSWQYNNLSISYEPDDNDKASIPVILFTPNMSNTNTHYHIDLSREEALILKEWLDAYIEDTK